MPERNYFTVEELNSFINKIFRNEELLHNLPVVGEVTGCSVVGGHCYFTLKDNAAQIKVCLFKCAGKYIPTNGEKVLVYGSVDYFAKGGTISLNAYSVAYFGAGTLAMQYNALKERLEKEGLFSSEHKKPIPEILKRIAVITSTKGAAIQDFITTVRKHNEAVNITIVDVRVQGEYCVPDIVTALTNTDNSGFDLIILARGGGSYEDLFCFNDEQLVRTVFDMQTPIVSAVGHETDYTLCDFVADYRAITPTAAGELVAKSAINQRNYINLIIEKMYTSANNIVNSAINDFVDTCEEMRFNMETIVQNITSKVSILLQKIKMLQENNIERENADIVRLLNILEQINPLKLLNNGYFRILSDDKYVYKIADLEENEKITILGIDGEAEAKIIKRSSDELRG